MRRRRRKKKRTTRHKNAHARIRARVRYGLILSNGDLACMVKMVQGRQGEYVALEDTGNSRSCWDLDWLGQRVRVIYSKTRKRIVTFLPLSVDDLSTPDGTEQMCVV